MTHWLPCALVALLLFGFWGFFPKMATQTLPARSVLVFEVLGVLVVGLVIAAIARFRLPFDARGFAFAFGTGLLGTVGIFFYILAMSRGKTSVVVTLTALYPVITILLAFLFLKEPVTLKEGVGILFALTAVVLFSV